MRDEPRGPRPGSLYPVLTLGVVAVSVAAPLIRLADAPPLSIAAYRLCLAALPAGVAVVCLRRPDLRCLARTDLWMILLAGLCLAGHFATWVASLKYTSVASSVTLVTTSPFFVAGFAYLVAGERTSRRMLLAIAICTCGGIVIGAADLGGGLRDLGGDMLALAGAAFAAAYLALGRRLRTRLSLVLYVGLVYGVAACALLLGAVAAHNPLAGFDAHTYVVFALLALVPQLFGHSALNWALRYVSAPLVATTVLGEPVIATALAAVFLGERPGFARLAGGILILAGVALALRDERMGAPGTKAAGETVA